MPAIVLAAEQSCLVHPALCTTKPVVKLLLYATVVLQRPHLHSQCQSIAQGYSFCELWQATLTLLLVATHTSRHAELVLLHIEAHLVSMDVLDLIAATQLPQFFSRLFTSEPHSAWHSTKQWMCSCTFLTSASSKATSLH